MGIQVSWAVVAFSIALSVVICTVRSIRAKKLTVSTVDIGSVLLNIFVWAFSMPYSIWMPGLIVVSMASVFLRPKNSPAMSLKAKIIYASITVIAPIGFFLYMMNLFEHRIVLSESTVSDTEFHRTINVPRVNLRVHATTTKQTRWIFNGRSWSWTTYSGDDVGPGIMGNEVFIGPHGLLSGDDLGRRLAKWAGTEPVYRFSD